MKNWKSQKSFTLIELLVVVAILGIIAAVVMPNVINFASKGRVEAANTEAHDVQTAVVAFVVDTNANTFNGTVSNTSTTGVEAYLLNRGSLQASYTFVNAEITSATPIAGSKWGNLTWNTTKDKWE